MSTINTPRFLEKFTNVAGDVSYTFPLRRYQLDASQSLKTAMQEIVGANYPVDLLGFAPALKDAGRGAQRALIVGALGSGGADVDSELDTMRHVLFTIGLGKLYTLDSASAERWAYARLLAMPSTTWTVGDVAYISYSLDWTIISDWYDATPYSHEFAIGSDPETITVPNSGEARCFNAIITLKGPWTNPTIVNSNNGYEVDLSRLSFDGASWLKIDAGQGVVLFSDDTGATFRGDFINVTIPTQQIQLMVLEPGDNSIVVTGCNGGSVLVEFSPPFD